jgi:hypothetical protein
MSQQDMSCWAPMLDAPQGHDEAQQLSEVTEALDSHERPSERLEWERTRWPEGAEL